MISSGRRIILLLLAMFFCGELPAQSTVPVHDFRVKGFHVDLRIQVMTMSELRRFARQLSGQGINTLLMEWEASYPYEKHRVISGRYAYTRQEIKDFVAYCNSLNIDVIPLQQSFGHVEYILKHHRYKELRQDQKDFSQVNPAKEELCKALFTDLFTDIISTHTSPYIHIGGDETYILDRSPLSKEEKGRIYGDYVKMIANLVLSLGKRPVIWADIALKYPDALKGLSKEIIFMDWNYGWDLNRFGDHHQLMASGHEIWGAPAYRSSPDNYFLTSWKTHFENIRDFVPKSRELGYQGIIITSWSTSGIYSPVFESATEMVDIPAVRRVYPQTGFNLIIEAFIESLKSPATLDIEGFTARYTREKYGFNSGQAERFLKALTTAPYEIQRGQVISKNKPPLTIKNLLDSSLAAGRILYDLSPAQNKEEYEHYLLMADIRTYYLTLMWIEDEMNREDYDLSKAPGLLEALNRLNPDSLDRRFISAHKDAYHASELLLENRMRNIRYHALKERLENRK